MDGTVATSSIIGPPRVGAEPLAAAPGVPWRLRVLLVLTTSRFVPDDGVDTRIVARLEILRRWGWMVRMAGARNYVLWRNARAFARPVRAVVLPNDEFPFTRDERNIAILRDLAAAEFRMRRGEARLSDSEILLLLAALLQALHRGRHVDEHGLRSILLAVDVKIQATLTGV
jgi:hypothetical protein